MYQDHSNFRPPVIYTYLIFLISHHLNAFTSINVKRPRSRNFWSQFFTQTHCCIVFALCCNFTLCCGVHLGADKQFLILVIFISFSVHPTSKFACLCVVCRATVFDIFTTNLASGNCRQTRFVIVDIFLLCWFLLLLFET